jgi:two-component system, OmpR family, response regulator TctD
MIRCILHGDRLGSQSLLGPGLALLGFEVVTADSLAAVQRNEIGGPCVAVFIAKDAPRVATRLRSSGFRGGILVLGPRADAEAEVAALDAGADDFMAPVSDLQVLRARVEALARRMERPEGSVYAIGPLRIDEGKRRVDVHGRVVRVSSQELALLALLARRRGEPVSRQEILSAWGAPDLLENGVDVCVARVRRKLGRASELLQTVRGHGFALGESRPA